MNTDHAAISYEWCMNTERYRARGGGRHMQEVSKKVMDKITNFCEDAFDMIPDV